MEASGVVDYSPDRFAVDLDVADEAKITKSKKKGKKKKTKKKKSI